MSQRDKNSHAIRRFLIVRHSSITTEHIAKWNLCCSKVPHILSPMLRVQVCHARSPLRKNIIRVQLGTLDADKLVAKCPSL